MHTTLYLSPDGNNNHSGFTRDPENGLDGPMQTPFAALHRIRQLRKAGQLTGTARVLFLKGRYPLNRPIKLTPEDSDLVLESEEPLQAELCGSVEVTGFQRVTLANGVGALQKDVRSMVSYHGPFNTLFHGERRLTRARWPSTGYIEVDRFAYRYEEVDIFQGQNEFYAKQDDLPETWTPGRQLQVNILHCWVHERQDVESIDAGTGRVTLNAKTAINPHYTTIPTAYFLENDLRFVTDPGDWFLDTDTGLLTVIPPDERSWEDFAVSVPVLTQWMRLLGDPEHGNPVRNVTVKGLRFLHADWVQGRPGETRWEPQPDQLPRAIRPVLPHAEDPTETPRPIGGGVQGACYLPGTVHGKGVHNSQFIDCDLEGASFYGIMLEEGCQQNRIAHCRFRNLGAGGVYLDGSPDLNMPVLHNRANTLSDCDIRDGGHVFFQACGILATHVAWTRILHNRVHDMTYTGISVGWHWAYDAAVNRDQLIEGNHVSDIGIRGDLWDMGGIYLLGYQPGTSIRGNVVEEIHCRGFSGWGLYLDEGSSGMLVERNLVWKTHSHSVHEHWGRQNILRHNCFAYGGEGGLAFNKEVSHSWVMHPAPQSRVEHNLIVSDKASFEDFEGLIPAGQLKAGFIAHDHNCMWCSTAEAGDKVWVLRENVYDENSPEHVHTLKQIQEKGQELHGEIRQVQPRWDRKTRTFTVDTPVPQLEGNAERWSQVGPRKMNSEHPNE